MPKGIRPTSGLVRESIFDVIGERIVGASFLDLFAGSGAIGLEALSRGARNVVFVEKSRRVVKNLRDNINGINNAEIINMDVMKFSPDSKYDIVFADPPYDKGFPDKLVKKLSKYGKLIIIEHSTREKLDVGETRKYGDTLITYVYCEM